MLMLVNIIDLFVQQAMKDRKKSPCQLALEHFDLHYKPVYGSQWPSVRIALLSKPKHCALINNFVSDRKQVGISLAERGAHDLVWTARERFVRKQLKHAGSNRCENSAEAVSVLHFTSFFIVFTGRQRSLLCRALY